MPLLGDVAPRFMGEGCLGTTPESCVKICAKTCAEYALSRYQEKMKFLQVLWRWVNWSANTKMPRIKCLHVLHYCMFQCQFWVES